MKIDGATWKQAAKKWRKRCEEIPSVMEFMENKKAATRRKELLRRCNGWLLELLELSDVDMDSEVCEFLDELDKELGDD